MNSKPKTVMDDDKQFEQAKRAALLLGALMPSITDNPGIALTALVMSASALVLAADNVADDVDHATEIITEALDFVMASHRQRQNAEKLAATPAAGMA